MIAAGSHGRNAATPDGRVIVDLPDETATAALAGRLAPLLRTGDIVALRGDLGAGKTSLARAVVHALGNPAEAVPSPTFTLVQTYALPAFDLWHFDLYRLESAEDAFELDIEEAFAGGVSLIEWPDRLGGWLPEIRLDIELHFSDDGESRWAILAGRGDWPARLAPLRDD
ncbi:MAG: tRNA (adenosine(37)-N6)-threonylcarbamoyltransferase complex ATPase subunit type 1 TsaE [Alphaproteobacteria bacterium]